jgi:ABC-2 type transport system permease protein
VDDRLLAYLWLKPIRSWVLPAAAVAATCTIMIPLVVVPLTVAAVATGVTELILPTAGAALLAVLAYSGLFVAAGARFSRALWWGLLYVLVWENAVARISNGTSLLAVRSYTVSILSRATDTDLFLANRSPAASILVPIGLAIAGVVVSAWVLRTRDIE